jgi:hypothetical protein
MFVVWNAPLFVGGRNRTATVRAYAFVISDWSALAVVFYGVHGLVSTSDTGAAGRALLTVLGALVGMVTVRHALRVVLQAPLVLFLWLVVPPSAREERQAGIQTKPTLRETNRVGEEQLQNERVDNVDKERASQVGRNLIKADEPEERQAERVRREPLLFQLRESCDRVLGARGRFGHELDNPIPVNGIGGQLFYLNTLRTVGGVGVLFHRLGSQKSELLDLNVDTYEVVAADGSGWATLYFSMYHPRRSREVPEGFQRMSWNEVPEEFKEMFHHPFMGVHTRVANFPLGLPEALQRAAPKQVGQLFARTVDRILSKNTGGWQRPIQAAGA